MKTLEEYAEKALEYALQLGVDYAEARYEKSFGCYVMLKNGAAEPTICIDEHGLGIRVLCGGGLAFTSTNVLKDDNVRESVEKCVKAAKALSAKSKVKLAEQAFEEASWEVSVRESVEGTDVEAKLEDLIEVDRSLLSTGVKLPSRLLTLGGSYKEKFYVNSEGAKIKSKVSRVRFSMFITASSAEKGVVQRHVELGETGGWEKVRLWNLADKAAEEAKTLGKILEKGKRLKPGVYDVVLGQELTGIISHEACGHPQEADRILGREAAQAGESYLKPSDLGKVIGSDVVTIVDDPTIPNSFGYYLYDDEGVKARRKYLIKGGVINEFLHNRETAAKLGVQSNGSARATDYAREPIVRMSNTFMAPGDYSFEELIEDIKLGVYIKTFLEWNIDDVRWNNRYVGLEAYLIENGELKGLVRDPVIEVTTGKLFSSIDAVSENLGFQAATCGKGMPMQGIPVWTGGPEARARGIEVKSR